MTSKNATTHRQPTRPASTRLLATVALVLGFLVYLSLSTTAALFTDSEAVAANTFSTVTLDLVDDDSGTAMFTTTGLYPGQSVERCIVVTQQGTAPDPGPVRVYTGSYSDTTGGTLAANLTITIDEGSGGSFATGDCTGFSSPTNVVSGLTIAAFDTTHTHYANGAGSWDPSSTPESRTYRVQVALDSAAPNSVQGSSVTFGLVWETQL